MISAWRPRPGWISTVARTGVAVASILGFMGHTNPVYAAQDVVITTTGDRLVGEIKRVEKDVLTISTGYSDSDFKIEWDKVASIESDRQFLVETFDGKRLSGSLKAGPEQEGGRSGRGDERAAGGGVGGAAVRADVLVAVRRRLSTSATA